MSLIHKDSCECYHTELDLQSVPPTQTSVESGYYEECGPVASLTDQGPIEFNIVGSDNEYLDLYNSHLYLACRIVNADGTDLANDAQVGPSNLFLHALFSQVNVTLGGTLVSESNNNYAYRAYIETLLSYGPAAKDSQLTAALWYKDTPGKMEAIDDNNVGMKDRKSLTARSRVVEMAGKLHSDIFFQERYMLNKVNLKLKLVRSKDSFSLMSDGTEFKVNVVEAALFVRRVKVSDAIRNTHAKLLEKGTLKYPIRRVATKAFTVPAGHMSVNQDNLITGQLPKRIVIGCVENDSFNASYQKNPYNFQHMNIDYLTLHVGGRQIPSKPLKPDFARNRYIRSYFSLFSGVGKNNSDEGNQISRQDYGKGYTLFAFDLTADLQEDSHFEVIRDGTVKLEMHFAQGLPSTITVLVYAEFDNLIEVDRARNISFDYSA